MITTFATAHPYWCAYILLAIPVVIAAIVMLVGAKRETAPAPSVAELLAQADANLADFAKTGRLRGPGGRFISTKDTR